MDVTEEQRIDAVRAHLIQRYQFLDADRVDTAIQAAHHRFDGCQIRGFVPLLVERAATPRPRRIPDHHPVHGVPDSPERRDHRLRHHHRAEAPRTTASACSRSATPVAAVGCSRCACGRVLSTRVERISISAFSISRKVGACAAGYVGKVPAR